MTRTFTNPKKNDTITSDLSDADAIKALRGVRSEFARSLITQAANPRRPLSGVQLYWVHKMAKDALNPPPKVTLAGYAAIIAMFDLAAQKLQNPKIRMTVGAETVKLSRAGARSQYAGQINVTDNGPFGDNVFYGRIDRNGNFEPRRTVTPAVQAILDSLKADPVKATAENGKLNGCCCYCNIELTDDRSLDAGYGPKCAKNYGLPWG